MNRERSKSEVFHSSFSVISLPLSQVRRTLARVVSLAMASLVRVLPVSAVVSRVPRRARAPVVSSHLRRARHPFGARVSSGRKHLSRTTFASVPRPGSVCLPANRVVLVKASSGSDGEVLGDDDQQPEAPSLLTKVADSKLFNTYLHLLVFVLILGFVDAGYSRDWTRIGAISPELEQQLRDLAVVLGEVHVACALVAGAVATKRNLPVAPAVAKTALVGFLALCEVCFKSVPADKKTE